MDVEKMVKAVKLCGSTPKVDQCKQCTYWAGGDMSKCIPRMTLDAAAALSTLQDENKRLNKIVCSIPTTPDSGRTVSQYEKEMSMCAYLDDLEAENEKLLSDLRRLQTERDTLLTANQHLLAEREQLTAERDAAVKDMEALMWFSGEGCHICAHEIIIHKEPYVRSECALGNCAACCPTWRGQKEG